MKRILQSQKIAICNICLEKIDIKEKDSWSREIAETLIEYAVLILKGKAGNLPAEQFEGSNNMTITIVAAELGK